MPYQWVAGRDPRVVEVAATAHPEALHHAPARRFVFCGRADDLRLQLQPKLKAGAPGLGGKALMPETVGEPPADIQHRTPYEGVALLPRQGAGKYFMTTKSALSAAKGARSASVPLRNSNRGVRSTTTRSAG